MCSFFFFYFWWIKYNFDHFKTTTRLTKIWWSSVNRIEVFNSYSYNVLISIILRKNCYKINRNMFNFASLKFKYVLLLFWMIEKKSPRSHIDVPQKSIVFSSRSPNLKQVLQRNEQQTNRALERFETIWVRCSITTTLKLSKYQTVSCILRTTHQTVRIVYNSIDVYIHLVVWCAYLLRFLFYGSLLYCACPFHSCQTIYAIAFVFSWIRLTEQQQ